MVNNQCCAEHICPTCLRHCKTTTTPTNQHTSNSTTSTPVPVIVGGKDAFRQNRHRYRHTTPPLSGSAHHVQLNHSFMCPPQWPHLSLLWLADAAAQRLDVSHAARCTDQQTSNSRTFTRCARLTGLTCPCSGRCLSTTFKPESNTARHHAQAITEATAHNIDSRASPGPALACRCRCTAP
jgi:hypothetical protein